jgi:hypothetical protein
MQDMALTPHGSGAAYDASLRPDGDAQPARSADYLRDHFQRMHTLAVTSYNATGQAHCLEMAAGFRRAMEILPAYAHPRDGMPGTWVTCWEYFDLKDRAGLTG